MHSFHRRRQLGHEKLNLSWSAFTLMSSVGTPVTKEKQCDFMNSRTTRRSTFSPSFLEMYSTRTPSVTDRPASNSFFMKSHTRGNTSAIVLGLPPFGVTSPSFWSWYFVFDTVFSDKSMTIETSLCVVPDPSTQSSSLAICSFLFDFQNGSSNALSSWRSVVRLGSKSIVAASRASRRFHRSFSQPMMFMT